MGYLLAYLVEIEGGYVLIDTGWEGEDTLKALTGQLDGIGVGFDEIRYVLVTHHHLDHMGQAAKVVVGSTMASKPSIAFRKAALACRRCCLSDS